MLYVKGVSVESNQQVVQIVISKLIDNQQRDRFVELTKQMKNWFLSQDGFVSYEAYENQANMADKIVYKNTESATRINQLFMQTDIAKEMLTLVDSDYTGFMGATIAL